MLPSEGGHLGLGEAAASTATAAGSPPAAAAQPPPPAGLSSLGASPPSLAASPFTSWWPGLRVRTCSSSNGGGGGAAAGGSPTDSVLGGSMGSVRRMASDTFASVSLLPGGAANGRHAGAAWHLNDPEHLVVCGSGGAFCHPTHVFSEARFRPEYFPAAGPIYLRQPAAGGGTAGAPLHGSGGGSGGAAQQGQQQQQQQAGVGPGGAPGAATAGTTTSVLQRGFPSGSSLYSLGHRGSEAEARRPVGGEYRCEQAFPAPEQVGGSSCGDAATASICCRRGRRWWCWWQCRPDLR